MEKLLTHIDRFTTSLRPLNFLIELVVEKMIPHQQARASTNCAPYYCHYECAGTCQYGHNVLQQQIWWWSTEPDCGGTICLDYYCNNC
jgi:hypothetical protein